jgi:hypothetical protein
MTLGFVSTSRTGVLSVGVTLLMCSMAAAQTPAPGPAAPVQSASASAPLFARAIQGQKVWITADGVRARGLVTSL